MKRIALVLALLWPLSTQAADAIIHLDTPGQTLYARVMTSSTASVAVALTEGTSNAVGRYVITEASLVSGGLSSAGNYPFKVFSGSPSTSANDPMLGQGVLYWSGSTVLAAPADITFVLGEAVDADPATLNVNVVTVEGVDATDTLGTAQTGDSFALLGTPVGASVSADIAAILDDTGTSGVVVAAGTEIEVADADLRAALGMAAADLDTQLASISVTLTAQDISDLTDGLVAGINEALVAVSPDVVTVNRTWVAQEYRATNIVEVGDNFAGTLALKPDLNPGTTISTVNSVTITGAATVTATDLTVDRSKTIAHFTVPALATTGTYTVVVTVTTVDGQTIPTTATLKVY